MDKDAAALQARFREGLALHRQGDLAGAELIYRDVLGRGGGHFDSLHMLGMIALQRRQTAEGIAMVKQAIAVNGRFAPAHNNLGKGWLDLGRSEDALPCFEEAIARDPEFVEAHVKRAGVLVALRRLDEALASYRKAASLRPPSGELERNCGNVLALMRRHPEAFAAYDKALRLDPELVEAEGYRFYAKMHLCDWDNWDAEIARLTAAARSGKASTQPFHFLAVSVSPADQLACARAWVARHFPAEKPRWGERYSRARIRIAYVSADFREHAASMLMAGMFEYHDRSKFEVTAISLARDDGSEIGRRVGDVFEHFIDATALSDDEVADLIKSRETDIAVDLMGFTTKSRTGILARRPAPVQAHYMGFPGTMGAPSSITSSPTRP
jgi:predicted O-linked N-acetylglucosamine transferase (SPINDLY family)